METTSTMSADTAADTTQADGKTTTDAVETVAPVVETKADAKAGAKVDDKAGEPKPDDKPEATKEEKPAGAPEAYEDFKSPEGVSLDTEVLTDLKALGKELNLPQDAAQKVVDLGIKLQQRNSEAWQSQIQKWTEEIKNDKDIGGEKLAENMSFVKRAFDQFGDADLSAYLESTGLGNNPQLVKAFYRIGKAISPDGFVTGNKNAGTKRDLAQRLYGNPKN